MGNVRYGKCMTGSSGLTYTPRAWRCVVDCCGGQDGRPVQAVCADGSLIDTHPFHIGSQIQA
eukprot:4318172-Amphidinium_carterae.1